MCNLPLWRHVPRRLLPTFTSLCVSQQTRLSLVVFPNVRGPRTWFPHVCTVLWELILSVRFRILRLRRPVAPWVTHELRSSWLGFFSLSSFGGCVGPPRSLVTVSCSLCSIVMSECGRASMLRSVSPVNGFGDGIISRFSSRFPPDSHCSFPLVPT
jgi:hypothetical protein